MLPMLWGGMTAGYQAIKALAQATKGLFYRQAANQNEQFNFTAREIDNYSQTSMAQIRDSVEDAPYQFVKGVLYGYNAYRLMTQQLDIISVGVGCVAAVETLKEVYDTATSQDRTPTNSRR